MTDRFEEFGDTPTMLARSAAAITPADADLAEIPKAVYVGTGGDVVVIAADDAQAVTFKNVPDGAVLPIRPRRIALATTAGDLVGLY